MSRKLNDKIKNNLYGVLISGFGMGVGIGMIVSNFFSLVKSVVFGVAIVIIGWLSVFYLSNPEEVYDEVSNLKSKEKGFKSLEEVEVEIV